MDDPSSKSCASSIIPAKATIYTSGAGKKGVSSVPLPTTKGSPLFLVPVERISPKLVEQYIQQGKGDGMKTRSSDKKKAKKPKQGSQVLVLIPSSNPNGSPTIQTLTSAEQLESTGGKKPLLLLPADKVPKSIASQSQTVRRKMVITMVAPSSGAVTGTKAKASSMQNVSATSTSSSGLWLDFFTHLPLHLCVDAVASWLVRSNPDLAVQVHVLAMDIGLCSWARHCTLTVPLSTHVCKWVPANFMLGANLVMDKCPIRGE